MTIRLLIVDDHPLLRMGVVDVVSGAPDIDVVGEFGCDEAVGASARREFGRLQPTVVLLGLHAPMSSTFTYANGLVRAGHSVVLLDESEDPERMLRALDGGFSAYTTTSGTADEMIGAIRHAHVCPGSFTAPGLAAAVRAKMSREHVFSTRECQVLMLLRDGYTSSAIATRLGVSDSTVKTYVARIYGKLDVSNRSQALVAALGRGLLPAPEADMAGAA